MTSRTHRPATPIALDALLTLAFLVLSQVEIREPWDDGFRGGTLAVNSVVVALAVAPLALRSVAPGLALGLMVAAQVLPSLVVAHTVLFWGGLLPMLLVVFTVARRDGGLLGRHTWAIWLPMLVSGSRDPAWFALSNVVFGTLMFGFGWFAGRVVRRMDERRQALAGALARLAEEQGAREVEAVARERSRLAAEMHDVVSHAVSLMVIQVGAARLELESHGAAGVESGQLLAAERTGREALDELRRSLGVLRGGRARGGCAAVYPRSVSTWPSPWCSPSSERSSRRCARSTGSTPARCG